MKRFDFEATKARMTQRARIHLDWAKLMENGTFSGISDTQAEGFAELSRYLEYLYLEKKWDTAQNTSSRLSMTDMVGYKPNRPVSATGYIVVSHTDAEGNNRLKNLGSRFFDIDELSNYDDITKASSYTTTENAALVPWTDSKIYSVPKGTRFISSTGVEFLATETISSRFLTEKYSNIIADDNLKADFLKAGGWNGLKYLKVPVIQGIQRTVSIGRATTERFQTFKFEKTDVENASNSLSAPYFSITLELPSGEMETWSEIRNIRQADAYDKVFEVIELKDRTGIKIKFGDGITGAIPTENAIVYINYLETLGASGNIDLKYQITTIAFPDGTTMIDPRTNTVSGFLSCTNTTTLSGGKDAATDDDIKADAPSEYAESYTTDSTDVLYQKILRSSPLSIMHLGLQDVSTLSSFNLNATNNKVLSVASSLDENTSITLINSSNTEIDNPDEEVIQPLVKALGLTKSPSDSFTYTEPNRIPLIAEVLAYCPYDVAEQTIKDDCEQVIAEKYAIQMVDFKNNIYSSVILNSLQALDETFSVSLQLSAIADINYDDIFVETVNSSDILFIPFAFDSIFTGALKGFKSGLNGFPFALRVDLEFLQDTTKVSKNKTFFLLDKRTNLSKSIADAKSLPVDSSISVGKLVTKTVDGIPLVFQNEPTEKASNRQVRVGQYPLITDACDPEYMQTVESYSTSPAEILPVFIDTEGSPQVFLSTKVVSSLQYPIIGDIVGQTCYKKNESFVENVDIYLKEATSATQATGYFAIPLDYFEWDTTLSGLEDTIYYEKLVQLLKNFTSIRISAVTQAQDIETSNWNDIAYIDETRTRIVRREN